MEDVSGMAPMYDEDGSNHSSISVVVNQSKRNFIGEYILARFKSSHPFYAVKILVVGRFHPKKHGFLFQQPRIRFGLFFILAVPCAVETRSTCTTDQRKSHILFTSSRFPSTPANLETYSIPFSRQPQSSREWPPAIKMKIRVNSS